MRIAHVLRFVATRGVAIGLSSLAPIVLAAPSPPPEPSALTDCVKAQMGSASAMAATFVQRQHLRVLSTPLESRGRVDSLPNGTIRWRVLEPIAYDMDINPDGTIRAADGSTLDHPAILQLVRTLLAMDTDALAASFALAGECGDGGWVLWLVPTEAMLQTLFTDIRVKGARELKEVVLTTRHGDSTTIEFAADEPADTVSPTDGTSLP